MTKRWELLNYIAGQISAKNYLEIGVQSGMCFEQIQVANKVGVDPEGKAATLNMTSDKYFESIKNTDTKFDLVFVDGLHHSDQVFKDIVNSLKHLSSGGVIVCHDMLPITEEAQQVPRIQQIWNGDCWKAFALLRATRPDLSMFTLNMDNGCGVVTRGEQDLIDISEEDLNYQTFCQNRANWMLTKPTEFIYDFFRLYY